jgi:hypothetical protein
MVIGFGFGEGEHEAKVSAFESAKANLEFPASSVDDELGGS